MSNLTRKSRLAIALLALTTPLAAMAASGTVATPAAQRAQAALDLASDRAALSRDAGDAFSAGDVVVDADGTEHVRFRRTWRGLRVIGGDIVVETRNGLLRDTHSSMRTSQRPSLKPRLGRDAAAVEAGARFKGDVDRIVSNQLVLYARAAQPVLAYEVLLTGDGNARHSGVMLYYVDANSGKILDAQDQIQTAAATGSGKSYYYGVVPIQSDKKSSTRFDMIDTTRGGGSVLDLKDAAISNIFDILFATWGATQFTDSDNIWGNHQISDRATVATDIHYGVGVTWDYYKNVHGRSGLFNDGKGIKSYAHSKFRTSTGSTGANAAFVDVPLIGVRAMFYGDGDAAYGFGPVVGLDVAGHEMSHGVNAATANLAYSGDAGGLNEGNSDIMGTLVEFYANNAKDPGDYRIGEMTRTDGGAFRLMYDQGSDGKSFNCYIGGSGFDPNQASGGAHDPHYTSGVANRFFYLLAEGAKVPAGSGLTPDKLVCNGDTAITGIGRDKAGKIWYRALTTKFTSSTTYPQARAATIAAAGELYGADSAEQKTVARAWSAARVN